MKVIDLLNKIANNEELPKYIKYDSYKWVFCKEFKDYKKLCDKHDEYTDWLFEEYDLINSLNDEIEIIEDTKEDKPIEKITIDLNYANHYSKANVKANGKYLAEKINEIIDRLNNLEKKEGK